MIRSDLDPRGPQPAKRRSSTARTGPNGSRARSWGRRGVWVIAIYLTGTGLLGVLAMGSGASAFEFGLMAFPHGAVLLTWLIVGGAWRRRRGSPLPLFGAFGLVLTTALAADALTGLIIGVVVLAATEAVLVVWSIRITWTLRPLIRSLDLDPPTFWAGEGPIGSLRS